jgi:UDP-N-acetylmuramate: L-alanyl-gamma-D-glutamyl-meso-diaminopimelate ligase
VIEADEYDTAFFDKRSKFVHYTPRTLILNNLEYDHADIFQDLAAIQRQFHHLMRLVPGSGRVIYPQQDAALQAVLEQGCWSEREGFGLLDAQDQPAVQAAEWQARKLDQAGSSFVVLHQGQVLGEVHWQLTGDHNISNALAALAAARHVGVDVKAVLPSLSEFRSVKRRMELVGEVGGVRVYDDFAHHPTAIATTLAGARPGCSGRLFAVIEPRSNTMKLGTLRQALPDSVKVADQVCWYQSPQMSWSPAELGVGENFTDLQQLCRWLVDQVQPGDHLLLMSNGSFGGMHQQVLAALQQADQVKGQEVGA